MSDPTNKPILPTTPQPPPPPPDAWAKLADASQKESIKYILREARERAEASDEAIDAALERLGLR